MSIKFIISIDPLSLFSSSHTFSSFPLSSISRCCSSPWGHFPSVINGFYVLWIINDECKTGKMMKHDSVFITTVVIKSALKESNLIFYHSVFHVSSIFTPLFFDWLTFSSAPFLSVTSSLMWLSEWWSYTDGRLRVRGSLIGHCSQMNRYKR